MCFMLWIFCVETYLYKYEVGYVCVGACNVFVCLVGSLRWLYYVRGVMQMYYFGMGTIVAFCLGAMV